VRGEREREADEREKDRPKKVSLAELRVFGVKDMYLRGVHARSLVIILPSPSPDFLTLYIHTYVCT
jgi:hypothetical protein